MIYVSVRYRSLQLHGRLRGARAVWPAAESATTSGIAIENVCEKNYIFAREDRAPGEKTGTRNVIFEQQEDKHHGREQCLKAVQPATGWPAVKHNARMTASLTLGVVDTV
jgi:hypothetical protein